MKSFLFALGFLSFGIMSHAQISGCTSAPNGQYPDNVFTPSCTGSSELIIDWAFTGEYSLVKVTENVEYEFSASPIKGNPVFITIATENGSTILASGSGKATWTANATQTVRFYTHLSSTCNNNDFDFTDRRVKCLQDIRDSYCEPYLDCTDGAVINRVTFSDIDNISNCSPTGFTDFTSKIAKVDAGESYDMTVNIGFGWYEQSVSVWIDYNKNFLFDDNEFIYLGTIDQGDITKRLTIPSTVKNGDYRMRIRLATVGESSATPGKSCNVSDSYGETEDYTLRVTGELATNESNATTLTISPNPVSDFVTITAKANVTEITVVNINGQIVKTFSNQKSINLKSLKEGVYIMNIKLSDGTTVNRKIIKK